MNEKPLILVVGASGYVGKRLVHELQKEGFQVRIFMRELIPISSVEGIEGELTDREKLRCAMRGVHSAYFLLSEEDGREGANSFGVIASDYGVKRVIILNCLTHTKSEVAQILRNTAIGVQVYEFRSSLILGGGSILFEAVEKLGSLRLPLLTSPSFKTLFQPIAISDVLKFLIKAITIDLKGHQSFEIGGSEKSDLTHIIKAYQELKGIKGLYIPSPYELSIFNIYVSTFTSLYRKAKDSLSKGLNIVVHDPLANRLFEIHPLNYKQALKEAIDEKIPFSRWVESLSASGLEKVRSSTSDSKIYENSKVSLNMSTELAFYPIKQFGNHYPNFIWKLKGIQDLLLGGVGVWRGRRDPNEIHIGEVIDFWRVESYEPNRKLRLRAEMKVPGKVWLEYHVEGNDKTSTLRQSMTFEPIPFWGRLYWYIIYPFHRIVFRTLFKSIVKEANEHANQVRKK